MHGCHGFVKLNRCFGHVRIAPSRVGCPGPGEDEVIRAMLSALAFSAALCATPAAADPVSQDPTQAPHGEYVLDTRHATLLAKVKHMGGFSKFTMRFDKLEGSFSYDPANWTTTKVSVTVDPASVDTNVPGFDKTLAGPSYLNAEKYPTITFVSTAAAGENGKGTVTGDLTFLGKIQPLTLDVTFNGYGPGLAGFGTRMGFSGEGHVKRSDFGLKVPFGAAGDDVDLIFEVEFVKK